MKKLIVLALTALFALGANAALAGHQEKDGPGPNGHNEHGLCTAYFNGQKNGHDKDGETGDPGPFRQLEEDSADPEDSQKESNNEEEQQIEDDVFEFCTGPLNPKGIGGNPEENGRYDCRNGDEKDSPVRDTEPDGEIECVANGDDVE